jgi:hypothetical protein
MLSKFREWLFPCLGLMAWMFFAAYAISLLLGEPRVARPAPGAPEPMFVALKGRQ